MKKADEIIKQNVFRQKAPRHLALRRYATLKGITINKLLDTLCEPAVEAGRPRNPDEPPPVDPLPDVGRPLDPLDR